MSQNALPETAEHWVSRLDSLLILTEDQKVKLEGIYLFYELERNSIELSLAELQTEPMDPMEWEIKDNSLRMRRKSMSKEREERILQELSSEQQKVYLERIAPNKPQVLHMGLKHDKINCNICVKPSTP
jgi:ABC-type sugar transport system ATPase subunit